MERRTAIWVRFESAAAITLVCLVVMLASGCGTLDQGSGGPDGEFEQSLAAEQGDLLAPDGGSGQRGFFPLDVGNWWSYAGEIVIVTDGGAPEVIQTREERSIIGEEERFGREYILEKRLTIDEDGDTLSPAWLRYRQDKAGLYVADIAANEPPLEGSGGAPMMSPAAGRRLDLMAGIGRQIDRAKEPEHRDAYRKAWEELSLRVRIIHGLTPASAASAILGSGPPGGVKPREITRLKYPLHPSQEWTIRDDPFYVFASVVGHGVLDLPPGRMNGYKIVIGSDTYGPDDLVYLWYGRAGYLGLEAHLEVEIVDPSGNRIGTLVYEEHTFLESLDLVAGGRW